MCLVLTNMERLFGDVKSCFFLLYVGKVWGPSLGSVGIKRGWKISGELRSFQTGHRQSFHGLTCALRRLLLSYTMEPVLQPHGHRGLWGGSPQPKGLSFHPGQTAGVKVLAPQRLLQVSHAYSIGSCDVSWGVGAFLCVSLNPASLASGRDQVSAWDPAGGWNSLQERSVMVETEGGEEPLAHRRCLGILGLDT